MAALEQFDNPFIGSAELDVLSEILPKLVNQTPLVGWCQRLHIGQLFHQH